MFLIILHFQFGSLKNQAVNFAFLRVLNAIFSKAISGDPAEPGWVHGSAGIIGFRPISARIILISKVNAFPQEHLFFSKIK